MTENASNVNFIEALNPNIPALKNVANYHSNTFIGSYRSNGVRSDCFPNNPISAPQGFNRHDAPFDTQSNINAKGKLVKATSVPETTDEPFRPFIGFMNDYEKYHNKYPTKVSNFYLS